MEMFRGNSDFCKKIHCVQKNILSELEKCVEYVLYVSFAHFLHTKIRKFQVIGKEYFYAIFMRRNTQFSCVEIRIKKAAFQVLP